VPLWKVLHDSPNADQTPTDYWEFASVSLDLRGNHYARKLRDARGQLVALEPIRPDIVMVYRRRERSHRLPLVVGRQELRPRRGGGVPRPRLRRRAARRLSTLQYARESLGIAIAADRAAGAMFANGVARRSAEVQGVARRRQARVEARNDIDRHSRAP
jgi:hypothetical protein